MGCYNYTIYSGALPVGLYCQFADRVAASKQP